MTRRIDLYLYSIPIMTLSSRYALEAAYFSIRSVLSEASLRMVTHCLHSYLRYQADLHKSEKGSQLSLALSFELKKWISVLIMGQQAHSLETVQALLVTACYSPDRSLILSFATRMALDLELPRAYDELTTRLVTRDSNAVSTVSHSQADDLAWMRQTRTWFCLLVLEHMWASYDNRGKCQNTD